MDAAKKLLATGLSKEQISSCLDLPIEKIEQLSKQADKSTGIKVAQVLPALACGSLKGRSVPAIGKAGALCLYY